MSSFMSAWAALLGNEGGYTVDDGGPTNWGITEAVARRNGYSGDMKDLPRDVAMNIAQKEYWLPNHCDQFSDEVAFQVLDAAYNGGSPARWLQEAVGVPVDGVIGPVTIQAVNSANQDKVVMRFLSYRLTYLTSLSVWSAYGKGWSNRIAHNLLRAAS